MYTVTTLYKSVALIYGIMDLKIVVNISMDSLNGTTVKKIIWKRSKSPMDVDDEIVDPSKCKDTGEERCHRDSLQLVPYPSTGNSTQPFALPLLPVPKVEEWCSNSSIALTGTACRGGTGPPVGVVDIGESKSAYYFCIALPGVKKDPGKFLFTLSLLRLIFFVLFNLTFSYLG